MFTDTQFAEAAFESASAEPERADWQAVAAIVFAAMKAAAEAAPRPKAKAKRKAADPDAWQCYDVKRRAKVVWPMPVVLVTFADGRTVRANAATLQGKPVNWGRGVRAAVSFYRFKARHVVSPTPIAELPRPWETYDRHIAVPEITNVQLEDDGRPFPVDVANRETAEIRKGRFDVRGETVASANECGEMDPADHLRQKFVISALLSLATRDDCGGLVKEWTADAKRREKVLGRLVRGETAVDFEAAAMHLRDCERGAEYARLLDELEPA